MPVPAAPHRTARRPHADREAAAGLLQQARHGLVHAEYLSRATERYSGAQLAALRAAAAVLAAKTRPRRGGRPTNAWKLLAEVCPELAEWSAFFIACSRTRAAADAGVTRLVSARDADDLVRQAGQFLALADQFVSGTRR